MSSSLLLEQFAEDLASVVPTVDVKAEHDRWQAGIGPFEEDRQIEMLREAVDGDTSYSIETEAPYLDGGQRVDLFIESEETAIPVEAKLVRFRYDNENINPNSFLNASNPSPSGATSTSHKLREVETDLIGAYYLEVGEAPVAQYGHTENVLL